MMLFGNILLIVFVVALVAWIWFSADTWYRVRQFKRARVSEPVAVSPIPSLSYTPNGGPAYKSPLAGILSDAASAMGPRKVSRDKPNIANTRAWLELGEQFPELVDPHVWITGSRVWRIMLGEPVPDGADLDVFATTTEAYDRVCNALRRRGAIITDRPAENRSHARGVGMHFDPPPLADGSAGIRLDVWYETGDVFTQLAIFPTDGYAHCRAAYNIARRSLVVLANENAK